MFWGGGVPSSRSFLWVVSPPKEAKNGEDEGKVSEWLLAHIATAAQLGTFSPRALASAFFMPMSCTTALTLQPLLFWNKEAKGEVEG